MTWAYPDCPGPNWGEVGVAADITGARSLRGFIRGREGGEIVELNVGGVNRNSGYDPRKPYQDPFPAAAIRKTLGKDWEPFLIRLPESVPLESVIGGFTCGFSKAYSEGKTAIYLDEVCFDYVRPDMDRLVRSYVPRGGRCDDSIRNAAFRYDNALPLLYFLSMNDRDSSRCARLLAESIVDAQTHDRLYRDGRWRNAYCCGPLIDPATSTPCASRVSTVETRSGCWRTVTQPVRTQGTWRGRSSR